METALKRATAFVDGGFAGLGRALGGVPHRTVWAWHSKNKVPPEYCPPIETLTGGAIRCEELNSDIDWAVLRRKRRPAKVAA